MLIASSILLGAIGRVKQAPFLLRVIWASKLCFLRVTSKFTRHVLRVISAQADAADAMPKVCSAPGGFAVCRALRIVEIFIITSRSRLRPAGFGAASRLAARGGIASEKNLWTSWCEEFVA